MNNKKKRRRAVITGIGIVSPIGIGKLAFWDNLLARKTGLSTIKSFDVSTYPSKIAAQVTDFDPSKFLTDRQIRYSSKPTIFALAAAKMALTDAQFLDGEMDLSKTDVVIGSAVSSFDIVESNVLKSETKGEAFEPGLVNPTEMMKVFISAPSAGIALMADAQGYVTTIASACTSGVNAIGTAASRIEEGLGDIQITGGVDAPITRYILSTFCSARFVTEETNPEKALRPFDKNRSKSALGEGSAIFILEEERQAIARGARIYARISGFGQGNENVNELFLLEKEGVSWQKTMERALKAANLNTVDHINAHGPSDKIIDQVEASVLHRIFKRASKIPVSSIKGSVGSGMASAGVFQVAAAALSIHHKIVPPTYNHKENDERCNLNVVRVAKKRGRLSSVLVNSHGLGGVNSSLVLQEVTV